MLKIFLCVYLPSVYILFGEKQNVLIFIKSTLLFGIMPNNSSSSPRSQRGCHIFLSLNSFTPYTITHYFWINFCTGIRFRSGLMFLPESDCPRTVISTSRLWLSCTNWGPCHKAGGRPYSCRAPHFAPFTYLSAVLPISHGPIYTSYTSWEIDGETVGKMSDFIFLGSKITEDGDCSHKIKRRLLLGRKVMTNLDSILKSRDITLPTEVRPVKATVFPMVMYGCESWTVKKAEHQELILLNCGVGEDSWGSLGLQGDPTSPS